MLITLEGIDGSGKSTVHDRLKDAIGDDDRVTFTQEPTDSWYGEGVRRSLESEDANPLAELFLYAADHADHLSRTVQPALDGGKIVISDRYADSRYAYQGVTLAEEYDMDDPMAYIRDVHSPFTPTPHLTIYLDISAEVGAVRCEGANKFEKAEYLRQVRQNYEELIAAEPERFVRVDATQPEEAVFDSVARVIAELLH